MKKILLLLPVALILFLVFRKEMGSDVKVTKKAKVQTRTKVSGFKLNERQKNILSVMIESKKHPMKYLESRIGNFNVRTLRRDLELLQRMGLIKKYGSTKSAFYQKI